MESNNLGEHRDVSGGVFVQASYRRGPLAADGPHDDAALGARVRGWGAELSFAAPDAIYSYSSPGYWLAGYAIEQAIAEGRDPDEETRGEANILDQVRSQEDDGAGEAEEEAMGSHPSAAAAGRGLQRPAGWPR